MNGIRDLSNEDYHAETEHLSSTQLKKALPEHYRDGDLNTAALDFGTLVHSVVLEPETLDRYTVLDAAKIGVKSDGTPAQNPTMTAAWKRAVAEAAEAGLTVVAQADWDKAHRMAEAVKAHPEASELLYGEGQSEVSAFATDENGVKVKARFDRLTPGAIVDLKTTSARAGADSLRKVVVNYLYDLSAVHYLEVARLCGLDAETFWFVFVSKGDEPLVTVANLSDAFLERGRDLRQLALERINGDAEPYEGATGRLTLHPPGWAATTTTTTSGGVISPDFTWSIHDEPA